ncbi:MAG: homogentisate phytyltransferase [Spirulinaceae cyanobacterium RM2_2_10]|nr:homogentisate phytyltransferase [Spirulinaceae cyanobacterium SM2_1_0]NJO21168.1 homogentisate phytyltransferase [Spirulinaceae cyanobacterium RM2_2_10]
MTATRPYRLLREPAAWLYSFWKFSRPHTIVGTSLSAIALYAIALAQADQLPTLTNLGDLLGAWLACLCGNVYIVGLNQLEDVAIDRVNKPHLPLAAGEFSQRQGQWLVGLTGAAALLLAALFGGWLLLTVGLSLAIGTAYSQPPIRLKRFPFWAALCIFAVRGAIVNLGLFLHFSQQLGVSASLPPVIWALALFILVFSVAIAIFKDIPDLEGDRRYNITTFTVLLGKPAIFNLTRVILSLCYGGAIAAGALGLPGVQPLVFIGLHAMLIAVFWGRSLGVDLGNKGAIAQFYQFIWKLFFLEYLLFPIACWLA